MPDSHRKPQKKMNKAQYINKRTISGVFKGFFNLTTMIGYALCDTPDDPASLLALTR
jgi:hypothetical protein